jgi:hypothetical protein
MTGIIPPIMTPHTPQTSGLSLQCGKSPENIVVDLTILEHIGVVPLIRVFFSTT